MPRQPDPVIGDPISAPWRKYAHREIDAIKRSLARLETDADAGDKGLQGTINGLVRTIQQLPIPLASSSTVQPTSANSQSFVTKATASLVVPEGKTRAVVGLYGTVVLLDTVSGGVAAPPYTRFLISGQALPLDGGVPAAKESGASQVNNVCTIAASTELALLTPGATLSAALQVSVFHSTAYATASAGNFATISMQATFLP